MLPKTPWPYARVAAHRGSGTMAPENTLEGFRVGLRHGYKAMETDAMLAKDGVPILMHDEHFGRTILDDARSVPELTSLEVQALDAGRWYSPYYTGAGPASLADALRWGRANGVWYNLEIKPADGHELETGRVVAKMTADFYADLVRPGGDRQESIVPAVPLLSSFKREALRGALEAAPDLPRGFLVDDMPEDWRDVLEEMRCVSFHTNQKYMTRELVREIKDLGYWVFCWTVNDPKRAAELLRWGVDGMCTDRLDLIAPCL